MTRRFHTLTAILMLVIAYFGCGKFGLALAFASASAVWPPTGVALAALLLWGYRLWPGVFLGALLVHATTHGEVAVALGIATGNTLEAVLGAWLVQQFAGGVKTFEQVRSIFRFVLLAGVLSTTVGATFGVTSLCSGGLAPWARYGQIWITWWLGDLVSNLLIAPLIVLWMRHRFGRFNSTQILEAVGSFTLIVLVGQIVFLGKSPFGGQHDALGYVAVLPLLWAAFRFGERGAITSAFLMSYIALWGTLYGLGPFAAAAPDQALLLLQVFIGTISLTVLTLAATVEERKQVEEWLRQSQAKEQGRRRELEALMEAVPAVVWIADDPECRRIIGNRLGYDQLNMSAGQNLSKTPVPGKGPQHYQVYENGRRLEGGHLPMQSVGRSGQPIWGGEYEHRFVDGTRRWIYGNLVPLLNEAGGVRGVLAAFVDITKRKEAERALRESEARFRAMAETIPGMIFTSPPNGEFDYASNWFYEYTGRPAGSANGFGWAEVFHPDDAPAATVSWIDSVRAGQSWISTYRMRSAKGDYRWFSARAIPLRDANGKIIKWFGCVTDIDDLVRAQKELEAARAQLKAHNEDLEVVIAERTQELRESIAELESFSYSISHDMRAPLRAMQGYASVLEQELKGKIGEEEFRYLGRIVAASARLSRLVQDILSYSQISRTRLQLKQIDLQALVLEVIQQHPNLQQPLMEVRIDGPLPIVFGHETALSQVWLNLLGNAAKFGFPGATPRVRIWAQIKDGHARIWVADNGIGIEPKNQERIFQMFERVNSPKEYDGTGIGLAIVKKAIERMGGALGVESELGKGARFWFELRCTPEN